MFEYECIRNKKGKYPPKLLWTWEGIEVPNLNTIYDYSCLTF